MRYAFLKEPKTVIGKLVSDAWKQFKTWWDKHKKAQVEESARESIRGRLAEFKRKLRSTRKQRCTYKAKGNRQITDSSLINIDGGVTRSRYMSLREKVYCC